MTLRPLLVAAALACASLSAGAVQVTWYVTGHMQTPAAGTPADLLALAPAGSAFAASFSFDSDSASHPLYFNSGRTDFVTSGPLAGTTFAVNGLHFSAAGSVRIIEQADYNGQDITLNGGAMKGPVPAGYDFGAVDVMRIGHYGPGSAPNSDKWPWFSPFGPNDTFKMISSAAPPDLSKSDHPASLDFFFYRPADGTYYHLPGLIESIGTTAPVPEPGSAALLAAGLAALAVLGRRRKA